VIRQDAAMPISRFCTLIGIPRRSYTRWRATAAAGGRAAKGPWPAPVVDAVEPVAARTPSGHLRRNVRAPHTTTPATASPGVSSGRGRPADAAVRMTAYTQTATAVSKNVWPRPKCLFQGRSQVLHSSTLGSGRAALIVPTYRS
jgi:hypothetical protein